jgi:flagellar hook-associated protein 2
MSTISFSGLASGVQWGALLDQLQAAETARRVAPIEQKATLGRQRIQAFTNFRNLVNTLATASKALRDGTALGATRASVGTIGGVAPFSVTTGAGAQPGTRSIEVVSLAQTEAWASDVHASAGDTLGLTGSFSLNGVAVNVDTDDSLNTIRDRINAANADVFASVLRVADGEYRLTLSSVSAGAAGIDFNDGDNSVGAALGLVRTRAGSDAVLNVDGVELRRATNTIADAVVGLTIQLQQVGGPVNVEVARDEEALITATKEFAAAFNAVRAFVDDQNSGAAKPLVRDPVLRQALNSFKDVLFTDAASPDAGALSRLALAGMTIDRQGRMQVDEARVTQLAASEPAALKALLVDVGGRMFTSADNVARAETGSIAGRTRSMNEAVLRLGKQADDARARVERMMERMTKDFLHMEDALGRITAQGNWLAGQIDTLYRPPRN